MTDDFGLPDLLFGPLPDWFFPAVGRVVVVSALLENKTQVLTETLANWPQDTLTMMAPSKMKKLAHKAAIQIDRSNVTLGVDSISRDVDAFFCKVLALLGRRNSVVHALWPAQPGEKQFGWRPRRLGNDDQTRITQDNTRLDMTDIVVRAAELIQTWNNLHGLVSYARTRAADGGYAGLPLDLLPHR